MEEIEAARELVRQARDRGVSLTGPQGLLKALTKTVIETALDEEMAEHVGYDKHAPEGRNRGNSRNGKRTKTVLTDACGEVDIEVPRDRDFTFEPVIVKKRQRRLSEVDEVVLSLYAKGRAENRQFVGSYAGTNGGAFPGALKIGAGSDNRTHPDQSD